MKIRSNSFFISAAIFSFFCSIFFLAFVKTHQIKGTLWADETGVVSSSLTKGRSLRQIFYDAANTSQPPLDHIIREKFYVPLGERLGATKLYPEFFHRLGALLWWTLPIGYFSFHLKNFSQKNIFIISLAFLFLISSEFLRHYLAEARHYSAIPAVFTTMIIILLSDQVELGRLKYQFLIISSLFPFLHLISFPYYLTIMIYFFYQIKREVNRTMIFGYIIYLILVLAMYAEIKNFSSPWQHPSYKNLLDLHVVRSNIKWSLDWIFYGSIIYPFYILIPEIIKNNFLNIFAIISIFLCFNFKPTLPKVFLAILTFFWPISILTTLYFSGMFGGERYSITIMPVILFLICWLIVNFIWKNIVNKKLRYISVGILVIASIVNFLLKILPVNLADLDTPDNQFIKQNLGVLKDKTSYLILDNGVYSAAFFPLTEIWHSPIKINYIQCRDGTFQNTGRNTLNDWLSDHQKDKVYLYSLKSNFMEAENILWQYRDFVLYRLTKVPEEELCQSPNSVGACYLKCIRGEGVATGGRSIRGVAPHLGVYRN